MRNFILLLIIIAIAYFTYKVYYPDPVKPLVYERSDIAKVINNSDNNKEPPHYKLIGAPVNWNGTLLGFKTNSDGTTKMNFCVNEEAKRRNDTILVTKINNINEFGRQNINKMLWFKGEIVRIDLDNPGYEVVYVNGIIDDAKFSHPEAQF